MADKVKIFYHEVIILRNALRGTEMFDFDDTNIDVEYNKLYVEKNAEQ